MSGAVKAVGKVFKQIGHAIKKLWDSPIVKAIVIAAAIYFTAGAAAGYFASAGAAAGGAAEGAALATTVEGATAAAGEAAAAEGIAGATELGAATTGVEAGTAAETGLLEAGAADAAGAGASAAGEGVVGEAMGNAAGGVADESAGLAMNPGDAGGAFDGMSGAEAGADAGGDAVGDAAADQMSSTMQNAGNGAPVDESAGLNTNPTTMDRVAGGMPGQGSIWDRITQFLKSKEGLTLAGQTLMGLGKGTMDSRSQEAQREWLAQQRAMYSAVPTFQSVYGPNANPNRTPGTGAVASRINTVKV